MSASASEPSSRAAASKTAVEPPRAPHYVGVPQLLESNAMIDRVVAGLEVSTSEGERWTWEQLSGGLPVVMVFVKRGCPCSMEFEPHFHEVERAYQGRVRLVDVIDADQTEARRYAARQNVPYPVLADPDLQIIQRFGAKNGAYVALLSPDGHVVGFWPGSSKDAMRDLGSRVAEVTGSAEQSLDVTQLPAAMTSGCSFTK